MTDEQRLPALPSNPPDSTTEEWIDESMAEGDIANGEGDPERTRTGDQAD
jgi:hypothetical protein